MKPKSPERSQKPLQPSLPAKLGELSLHGEQVPLQRFSKNVMLLFALSSKLGRNDHASIQLAGYAWGRLVRHKNVQQHMQWGSNDPLKRHGIWDNDTTILLEDVAALVDTYDEDKLAIPSITPSNSLGKNWGLGTIEFCRAFVEDQLTQPDSNTHVQP